MSPEHKKIYLLLLLLSTQLCVYPQNDSLLHQPYHKKSKTLGYLFSISGNTDSISTKELQRFYDFAETHDDTGLKQEADLLQIYGVWKKKSITVDSAAVLVNDVILKAVRQNNWVVEARAYRYLAYMYWKDQAYENMFSVYYKLNQLLENTMPSKTDENDWLDYSLVATSTYTEIGESYYFFKDNQSALYFLEKTTSLEEVPLYVFPKIRSWNSLGLVYRDLEKMDESSALFKKVMDTPDINPVWKAIAGGNLGHNYYITGQYDMAIPLLEKNIEISEANGIYGEVFAATLDLGNIELARDNLEVAGEHFRKALIFQKKSSNDDQLHYTYLLYEALSKWNAAMGNHKLAILYIDSTKTAQKEHNSNFNTLKLMRAQQKINEQHSLLKEEKKKKEIQQRNLIIVIVLILLIVGIIFYFYRQKYFLEKHKIDELALENSKQALQLSQTRLNNLTHRIRENNKLIEALEDSQDIQTKQKILKLLKTSIILTDDDWAEYRSLFLEVYPNFITTLRDIHPDLTPSEIRCLCLEKLKLSNKEMGFILGVSSKSVMVTKHRIRKKISIDTQKELEDLVVRLG